MLRILFGSIYFSTLKRNFIFYELTCVQRWTKYTSKNRTFRYAWTSESISVIAFLRFLNAQTVSMFDECFSYRFRRISLNAGNWRMTDPRRIVDTMEKRFLKANPFAGLFASIEINRGICFLSVFSIYRLIDSKAYAPTNDKRSAVFIQFSRRSADDYQPSFAPCLLFYFFSTVDLTTHPPIHLPSKFLTLWTSRAVTADPRRTKRDDDDDDDDAARRPRI